jgi:hypothetical protein
MFEAVHRRRNQLDRAAQSRGSQANDRDVARQSSRVAAGRAASLDRRVWVALAIEGFTGFNWLILNRVSARDLPTTDVL